ncbi:MAG: DUF3313 family protein [Acidobacteria bacterium]|nr:DUF3313 family protein [Acidobacteriota bacterium]
MRSMVRTLIFVGLSAATSWAGPGLVAVPVTLPLTVRFLTSKHVPAPPCDMQMVASKGSNYVCANPDIDWSSYGKVDVVSVDIAATNLKKPLSDREIEQLKTSLAESLKRQFADITSMRTGRKLQLRATVTEIRRSNKALNIISLAAIQAPLSFGGATTHIEVADGDTGKTLAELTIGRRGRNYDVFSSTRSLGHAKKSLNRTSKQINKDIQLLRSKFNTVESAAVRPD